MRGLLYGKKAIITGASSGIGKGIAEVFAREGADIAITYRSNQAGAEATAQILREFGAEVLIMKINTVNLSEIETLIQKTTEQFGALDIMVNNAGITPKYEFLKVSETDFDELFSINCRGTFFCTQYASRYMKENGGGNIINISSLSTRAGTEGFSVYASTKSAMNKFSEIAAIELGPANIRINTVAAGWIPVGTEEQNMSELFKERSLRNIPVNRFGKPEDIGEICAFLASDRASFITGQTFLIDGGQSTQLTITSRIRDRELFEKRYKD